MNPHPPQDVPKGILPSDSITKLTFSPVNEHLFAVASMDGSVRIFGINVSTRRPFLFRKHMHTSHVLDLCWSKELFAAAADGSVAAYDVEGRPGQGVQGHLVAMHCQAVNRVRAVYPRSDKILITAGWDQTIKFWELPDTRPRPFGLPQPLHTLPLPSPVLAMDSNDAFMVLCMADKVHVVDLSRPFEPLYSIDSNWGIPRDVSVFSSGMYDTFAVASDGGHVALHDVRGRGAYPSPCHRVPSAPPKPLLLPTQPQQMAVDSTPSGMAAPSEHVFPVHGITHHPTGSFVSAGGDGALTFWSTIGQVLKYLPSDALGGTPAAKVAQNPVIATPLVTVSYSRSGNLVAYASSADWTRGPASGSGPNVPVRIIVRTVANDGKMAS